MLIGRRRHVCLFLWFIIVAQPYLIKKISTYIPRKPPMGTAIFLFAFPYLFALLPMGVFLGMYGGVTLI